MEEMVVPFSNKPSSYKVGGAALCLTMVSVVKFNFFTNGSCVLLIEGCPSKLIVDSTAAGGGGDMIIE